MLTIWDKVIQNMVLSGEESSIDCALTLITKPQEIFHWWAISYIYQRENRLNHLGLPHIPKNVSMGCLRDRIYEMRIVMAEYKRSDDSISYLEKRKKYVNYME